MRNIRAASSYIRCFLTELNRVQGKLAGIMKGARARSRYRLEAKDKNYEVGS